MIRTLIYLTTYIARVQFKNWPLVIFWPINHNDHSKQTLLGHFYRTIFGRSTHSNRTIILIEQSKHSNKAVSWPGCTLLTYLVCLLLEYFDIQWYLPGPALSILLIFIITFIRLLCIFIAHHKTLKLVMTNLFF